MIKIRFHLAESLRKPGCCVEVFTRHSLLYLKKGSAPKSEHTKANTLRIYIYAIYVYVSAERVYVLGTLLHGYFPHFSNMVYTQPTNGGK